MDINKQYNYQPYTGGAGPTEQQEKDLNELLIKVLTENNIGYTITKEQNVDPEDAVDFISVDGRQVCYDRWGYNSEDVVLDQSDLQDAFRYLAYKHMTMRQLAKWVEEHADDEEAWDLLQDYRADDGRDNEPEDSPRLEDPWWRNK